MFRLARETREQGQVERHALVSVHLVAEYVVAVYETAVVIYKQSGEQLQEFPSTALNTIGSPHKFKYVKGAVNTAGENEVILLAANQKEAKNTVQAQVIVLREKDP